MPIEFSFSKVRIASLFNNDPALCAKEWAEAYRFAKKEEQTKKD